jgi:hypothetical protein
MQSIKIKALDLRAITEKNRINLWVLQILMFVFLDHQVLND